MSFDLVLGRTSRDVSRGPSAPGQSPALAQLITVGALLVLPRLLRGAESASYRLRYRTGAGGRRLRQTLEMPAIASPAADPSPLDEEDVVVPAADLDLDTSPYLTGEGGRRLRRTLEMPVITSRELVYGHPEVED